MRRSAGESERSRGSRLGAWEAQRRATPSRAAGRAGPHPPATRRIAATMPSPHSCLEQVAGRSGEHGRHERLLVVVGRQDEGPDPAGPPSGCRGTPRCRTRRGGARRARRHRAGGPGCGGPPPAPSPDSPTTSMSGLPSTSSRRPRRTISWSSSRKTLMGCLMGSLMDSVPVSSVGVAALISLPWSFSRVDLRDVPVQCRATGPAGTDLQRASLQPWRGCGG